MAKQLLVVLTLVAGVAFADDSGYGAPSGYQPSSGYGVPSAPADNYGVPDAGYGAPAVSYQDPGTGYGAPVAADDGGDLFNLDKILELLPFFLAVFAAILVAQLLAPLLTALSGLLMPVGNLKIDLINFLLSPLNLAICNTNTNPITLAGTPPNGRSLASGFNFSDPAYVDLLTNTLYEAIKSKSFFDFLILPKLETF